MTKPCCIMEGSCLELLRTLPKRSIHCMVTSPPYYLLRRYDGAPQIWGGKRDCDHRWKDSTHTHKGNTNGRHDSKLPKSNYCQQLLQQNDKGQQRTDHSNTCRKCGAWRGSFGNEPTLKLFVKNMVRIFREVHRVLRDDGTVWLNLGDSYAGGPIAPPGSKLQAHNRGANDAVGLDKRQSGVNEKNLMGMPWRVALALQADGWYLRSDIIWDKINPMPESVRDRPTRCHEYLFLLSKRPRYYYDLTAIAEQAVDQPDSSAVRNRRDVWHITTAKVSKQTHFASFPEALVAPCIKAGTSEKGCCPKCGAPWRRVTHSVYKIHKKWYGTKHLTPRHSRGTAGSSHKELVSTQTIRWEPTCTCKTTRSPRPCTVLDIFSGSGTTVVVALKLHRHYLGLELNPEYVVLSQRRCHKAQRSKSAVLDALFTPSVVSTVSTVSTAKAITPTAVRLFPAAAPRRHHHQHRRTKRSRH